MTNTKQNLDGYIDLAKKIGTKNINNTGFGLSIANDSLFSALYTGNGLVKRLIDLLSDDMVRQWVTIPEDTEGKVLDYMKRLKVKTELKKAIRSAKLFGGGLVFMVIEDGLDSDEPVNINNIKSIKKLKFFSKHDITIEEENYYNDEHSSKFGDPEFFTIAIKDGTQVRVHETRCLIFKGDEYPKGGFNDNSFWGMSILQPLHETLESYNLALQSILQVFQKFNIDVLRIKNLMALLSSNDGVKQLEARGDLFDLAKSVSTTLLLDSEESFEVVSQNLSGVSDVFSRIQETISSMTGVPSNILMGSSPKGLNANGSSEIRIYYDKIKSDQEEELLPQLEYLVELISYSKDTRLNRDQGYNIDFVSLWQQTDEERVKTRKAQAEIDQIYINNGVYDPNEVRESRFGNGKYSIETTIEGEVNVNKPNIADTGNI